ncbi:hypothetical protein Sjap_001109 [Stephania japonica]|uniref:PHD finger protein ALFIN-LIKE n=1 Tax=Stephania japonica TaxID=461633 RepID=A0AAP0KLL7_9MAGN
MKFLLYRRSLIARINRCPTVVDAVAKHMRDIFGWNDESEDNEEHKACGSCSGSRKSEFWIKCDRCGTLYHGDCMQITPRMDKKIGKYRCPYCGPRG